MRKTNILFITSVAVLCLYSASRAAQNAPTLGSKYGLIQGVNNYSSAPYWNPNSPYNARIPTPIYATGTDVTTGDCNTMVDTLIASFCVERNNCAGLQLKDVRPTIMIQLAEVPNHNYATACGGYIDGAYDKYMHGGKVTGNTTKPSIAFPTATANKTVEINNPFVQKPSEYQVGVAERASELKNLQAQTAVDPSLKVAEFPKTMRDLSFGDRTAIIAKGYEPYKEAKAYVGFSLYDWEHPEEFEERKKKAATKRHEANKHKINYDVSPLGGICPTEYVTNDPEGHQISCEPQMACGTFVSWCTNPALTGTCLKNITIPQTDSDTKYYYANINCGDDETVCKKQGKICVDPRRNQGGGGNDDDGNNNPNNCKDPTHMDANCNCTVPNSHKDKASGMCACDNPSMDINNNCTSNVTATGPRCLLDAVNDTGYQSYLNTNLGSAQDIEKWINTHKSDFYTKTADVVIKYCLDKNAEYLTEFNEYLDSNTTLALFPTIDGNTIQIPFDAEELFYEASGLLFVPFVVERQKPKTYREFDDVTNASFSIKNLDLSDYGSSLLKWHYACAAPFDRMTTTEVLLNTDVGSVASPLYEGSTFKLPNYTNSSELYMTGMLCAQQTDSWVSLWKGTAPKWIQGIFDATASSVVHNLMPAYESNYVVALKKFKQFSQSLKANGTRCKGAITYLVRITDSKPEAKGKIMFVGQAIH